MADFSQFISDIYNQYVEPTVKPVVDFTKKHVIGDGVDKTRMTGSYASKAGSRKLYSITPKPTTPHIYEQLKYLQKKDGCATMVSQIASDLYGDEGAKKLGFYAPPTKSKKAGQNIATERSQIGNNAWTMYKNLVDNGGLSIFNNYEGKTFKNSNESMLYTQKNHKNINSLVKQYGLQEGDVVGLAMNPGGSHNWEKAYQESMLYGSPTPNTHIGIIGQDKDGKLKIFDSISGVGIDRSVKDYMQDRAVWAVRPNPELVPYYLQKRNNNRQQKGSIIENVIKNMPNNGNYVRNDNNDVLNIDYQGIKQSFNPSTFFSQKNTANDISRAMKGILPELKKIYPNINEEQLEKYVLSLSMMESHLGQSIKQKGKKLFSEINTKNNLTGNGINSGNYGSNGSMNIQPVSFSEKELRSLFNPKGLNSEDINERAEAIASVLDSSKYGTDNSEAAPTLASAYKLARDADYLYNLTNKMGMNISYDDALKLAVNDYSAQRNASRLFKSKKGNNKEENIKRVMNSINGTEFRVENGDTIRMIPKWKLAQEIGNMYFNKNK